MSLVGLERPKSDGWLKDIYVISWLNYRDCTSKLNTSTLVFKEPTLYILYFHQLNTDDSTSNLSLADFLEASENR